MPSRQSISGKSHGPDDRSRSYGGSHLDEGGRTSSRLQIADHDRTSSRHQIEDRSRTSGSSRALERASGGSRSDSQSLARISGDRSSSHALDQGNFGRDEYESQSGTSRLSRTGASSRDDGRNRDELRSSRPFHSSSAGYGHSRIATRDGPSRASSTRLGEIEEEDERGFSTTMGRSVGPSQALTRRGHDGQMTSYGGATMRSSRRKTDFRDDETDSEQEVVTKNRFSKMSGQLLLTKFPELGELLENVLQIKPAKLDEYCEAHYIRLDLTKNRADISKLLKNSTPNDREKCEKAIKKYDTHQENERHLNGGMPARSIFEPTTNHKSTHNGGTVRNSGTTSNAVTTRHAVSTSNAVTTRDGGATHTGGTTRTGGTPRDGQSTGDGKSAVVGGSTQGGSSNHTVVIAPSVIERPVYLVPAYRPVRRCWYADDYYGRPPPWY